MKFYQVLSIIALAATGVVAIPGPPPPPHAPAPPPKPQPPPVINAQINYCSSGAPYCCSPSETGGTTCKLSTTQCNSVSICCNNAANGGGGAATQYCSATSSLNQPVYFE